VAARLMDQPRLICRDVWVGYRIKSARGLPRHGRTFWAVRGLDLSVQPGEMVGLVGTNGSGKTTFLRTVAGVFEPSRGTVESNGKVGALVELRPDSDRDLSVRERMTISGVLLGFRQRDAAHLEMLVTGFGGLDTSVLDSPVYTLSTGMLLRLEMSLLLHASCDVLAVDELLMSADSGFKAQCLRRMRSVCEEGGAALLSSHDPALLSGCNRIVHLEQGSVKGEDTSPDRSTNDGRAEGELEVQGPLALVPESES
jgi:ABC-type polysaccharide/polyol phosphate transport system ATPase subunit